MSALLQHKPVQFLVRIQASIAHKYDLPISRSLQVTGLASLATLLVGAGKLLMGLLSFSVFTCVSGLYTFCMVLAKYCAFAGILKTDNVKDQYRYYTMAGFILVAASVLYIIYSIRLFLHPATVSYHMIVAIGIAAFTFAELIINIRGVMVTRHKHDPLIHAVKMINLASALICLVLTQIAILSFTSTDGSQTLFFNGLFGVIMGTAATLIGIFMVVRIKKWKPAKTMVSFFQGSKS